MYGQGQQPQYPQQGQPPYGQPPQYGTPQQPPQYGAPQPPPQYGAPQQPGYGAPQQPGYGQPQQPQYGYPPQQPAQPQYGVPQQAGYGGYPPAPPAKKGKGGLVIGLVIGALVLGGGGFAIWKATGSSGGSGAGSSTAGKYKVSAPQSLPGGYTQKSAQEKPASANSTDKLNGIDSADGSMTASYTKDATDTISLGGSWGTISDPGAVITAMKAALSKSSSVTWSQPLASVDAKDPHDPSGQMQCGVATSSGIKFPVCVWSNHSTAGSISFIKVSLTGDTGTMSTDQAATQSRAIRDAAVVAK